MMRIHIYTGQKKLLPFCKDAAKEYVKRLGRYAKVKWILGDSKRRKPSLGSALEAQGQEEKMTGLETPLRGDPACLCKDNHPKKDRLYSCPTDHTKERTLCGEEQGREEERNAALHKGNFVMVVTPTGHSLSSEALAQKIQELTVQGISCLEIYIGWPQAKGDFYLKLTQGECSPSMETVLLAEQLYRSFRIANQEPYHK